MTRINPIDLSFLLLERANRPNHMAAYTIFEKPKGQKSSFGPRLFDAYRHSQAAKPFNHKLKWLGTDVAARECGDIKHEGAHRAALPCRCAAGGVQWPAHRAAGRRA